MTFSNATIPGSLQHVHAIYFFALKMDIKLWFRIRETIKPLPNLQLSPCTIEITTDSRSPQNPHCTLPCEPIGGSRFLSYDLVVFMEQTLYSLWPPLTKTGVFLLFVHRLGRAHGSVPFIRSLVHNLVTLLCSHPLKSLIKYTPNLSSKVG